MSASDYDVLNLGSGENTPNKYWNVDIEPLDGVDEVVDLDARPWPWDVDTWSIVRAEHVLEHLRDPLAAVEEIERITAPGGTVIIRYPIGHPRFEDPTHRHYWNYNTADWLAGNGKHGHENPVELDLVYRTVEWDANGLAAVYARLRERFGGNGPWLSQVPSLGGEVTATYEVHK